MITVYFRFISFSTTFDDVTASFVSCSNFPSSQQIQEFFQVIERYVTLLYDPTSMLLTVNECRKSLFATKGRSLDATYQQVMLFYNIQNGQYFRLVIGENVQWRSKTFWILRNMVGNKKKTANFQFNGSQSQKHLLFVGNSFTVVVTQQKDAKVDANAKRHH